VGSFPNCGTTGVFGFVRDQNRQNMKDVYVRIWTDNWKGIWAASSGSSFGNNKDRNYEVKVADGVVAGNWHVAVVKGKDSEKAISPVVDVTSSQNCEGSGAVQWTKVDFTKNF
jgi:hypothetical protein